jgi:tartrate dehydratase alpha subunit/fumarate hydratase class I-like protein
MAIKLEYASTRIPADVANKVKQLAARKEWSYSKTIAKLIEKGLQK